MSAAHASLSAVKAARLRSQDVASAHHPGSVIIGGVTYPCALKLEAVGFEPLPMGGAARAQRLRCDIRKTRMATPPAKDSLVTHGGVDFKIGEIGGRNVADPAWIIRCLRWVE